jgi:UDP-glucose 4-epimerase
MKCLVTGAAGFIGSHLCLRLLQDGFSVRAVDCFTDYYARELKEANLAPLLGKKGFTFIPEDLNHIDLPGLLDGIDGVFHLAAQAGVRASWGKSFSVYTQNNIEATQRLLEAAKGTDIPHAALFSLRGEQTGGRAPVPALLHQLWCSDRVPAVLHGLRSRAEAGHGL